MIGVMKSQSIDQSLSKLQKSGESESPRLQHPQLKRTNTDQNIDTSFNNHQAEQIRILPPAYQYSNYATTNWEEEDDIDPYEEINKSWQCSLL
ncbi:unnamed protein product [Blepharisma stoltei]|uniref:Uncharacterized protein n=1 Tax=Blepharisma stoltei TaxID=1481888 RepID=A0AAU9J1Y5_9CILI|nr:unnamed protein product [Blepharisma stoltei]